MFSIVRSAIRLWIALHEMSRRTTSISTIFCRLLVSLVVIRSSCCGWSAYRRVCRAVFAPSINCSWRTRRLIGARYRVWRTWTLLAENVSLFLRTRCSRWCQNVISMSMLCRCDVAFIDRSVETSITSWYVASLSFLHLRLIMSHILLFSARYDSYYSIEVFLFLSSYF